MVGFVLYDPQDPMKKIVQKVIVGERPKLLAGRNPKGSSRQHRRHIVAYDILAKSLRKMLKGRCLGDIADWLDKKESWLDPDHRLDDLHPRDGVGKVIRSVFGVQGATAGWMKNAANYAENIFNGDKTANLQLSGVYTGGRDLVKASWEGGKIALLDLSLIYCVEISSGRSVGFKAGNVSHPAGTEVRQVALDIWNQNKGSAFFKAEVGTKFVAVQRARRDEFNGVVAQSQADVLSVVANNMRSLMQLGGAFRLYTDGQSGMPHLQKLSREYHWNSAGPTGLPNPALARGQEAFLSGGVDIHADAINPTIQRYKAAINRLHVIGFDGQRVYLFDQAIGSFPRGKYMPSNFFS